MKNLILIASCTFLLASCNQEELSRTQHQKDSLMTVLNERDKDINDRETSIQDFISSFNEIEQNLDSIAVKQQMIYLHADKARGDSKASQKDRINAQIKAINNLMESNRTSIANLERKLKGSSKMNKKLKETIATLNAQLAQKDMELAALNEKLTSLNMQVAQLQTSVDTLNIQNSSRAQIIADNTIAMHTAYYIVGKTKDLRDSKLIDRKGGLLGVGRTSKMSSNFDKSKFTKIDYTQVNTIPVNSKNVKIITTHPAGSYTIEKDPKTKSLVRNIVITDAESFWSASKYLVVEGVPVNKADKSLSTNDAKKEKNF